MFQGKVKTGQTIWQIFFLGIIVTATEDVPTSNFVQMGLKLVNIVVYQSVKLVWHQLVVNGGRTITLSFWDTHLQRQWSRKAQLQNMRHQLCILTEQF